MANFVGQAWVQVLPSFTGFQQAITREVNRIPGQMAGAGAAAAREWGQEFAKGVKTEVNRELTSAKLFPQRGGPFGMAGEEAAKGFVAGFGSTIGTKLGAKLAESLWPDADRTGQQKGNRLGTALLSGFTQSDVGRRITANLANSLVGSDAEKPAGAIGQAVGKWMLTRFIASQTGTQMTLGLGDQMDSGMKSLAPKAGGWLAPVGEALNKGAVKIFDVAGKALGLGALGSGLDAGEAMSTGMSDALAMARPNTATFLERLGEQMAEGGKRPGERTAEQLTLAFDGGMEGADPKGVRGFVNKIGDRMLGVRKPGEDAAGQLSLGFNEQLDRAVPDTRPFVVKLTDRLTGAGRKPGEDVAKDLTDGFYQRTQREPPDPSAYVKELAAKLRAQGQPVGENLAQWVNAGFGQKIQTEDPKPETFLTKLGNKLKSAGRKPGEDVAQQVGTGFNQQIANQTPRTDILTNKIKQQLGPGTGEGPGAALGKGVGNGFNEEMGRQTPNVRGFVDKIKQRLSIGVTDAYTAAKPSVDKGTQMLGSAMETIGPVAGTAFGHLRDIVGGTMKWIIAPMSEGISVTTALSSALRAFSVVAGGITLKEIASNVFDGLKRIPGMMKDAVVGVGRLVGEGIKLAGQGLAKVADLAWEGIKSAARGVSTAVVSATTAVVGFSAANAQAYTKSVQFQNALELVANQAGVSNDTINDQIGRMTKLGSSTSNARDVMMTFVRANMDATKAWTLYERAEDLAVTTGQTGNEVIQQLTHGIETQNVQVLRNAGVIISVDNAMDTYAATLGKARDELTAGERQTALFNEVMAKSANVAGVAGKMMQEGPFNWKAMQAPISNISTAMGSLMEPAFTGVGRATFDLARSFAEAMGEGGKLRPIVDAIREVMKQLGEVLGGLITRVKEFLEGLDGNVVQGFADKIKGFFGMAKEGETTVSGLTSQFQALAPVIGLVGGSVLKMGGANLSKMFGPLAPIIENVTGALGPFGGLLVGTVLSSEELRNTFLELVKSLMPMVKELMPIFQNLMTQLTPLFRDLGTLFSEVLTAAFQAIMPLLPDIAQLFVMIMEAVRPLFPIITELAVIFIEVLGEVFARLMPGISALVDALGPSLTPIALALGTAFEAVGEVLPVLASAFNSILLAIAPILPIIAELVAKFIELAAPIIVDFVTMLAEILVEFAPILTDIFRTLAPVVEMLLQLAADVIAALMPSIRQLIDAFIRIFAALAPLIPPLAKLIAQIVDLAMQAIIPLLDPLIEMAEVLVMLAIEILKPLIPLLTVVITAMKPWIGMISTILAIIVKLINVALKALIQALKPVMDIIVLVLEVMQPWYEIIGELMGVVLELVMYALMPLLDLLVPLINIGVVPLVKVLEILTAVLTPVINVLKSVVEWVSNLFKWIVGGSPGLIPALEWLKDVFDVVWGAISSVVSFVWNSILKPIFDAIISVFESIGDVFMWVWENAIKFVWDAFRFLLDLYWNYYINPIFEAIKFVFRTVGDVFMWVWENVIKRAFDAMRKAFEALGDSFRWVKENIFDKVWDGLKTGIEGVASFFEKIWDGIKKTFGSPVKWVLEYAILPLMRGANFVLEKIGLGFGGTIGKLESAASAIPSWRHGGRIPGWGGGDSYLSLLEPGEWVLTKEQARRFGYGNLRGLPRFQEGGGIGDFDFGIPLGRGILGGIVSAVGGFVGDVAREAIAAIVEGIIMPLRAALNAIPGENNFVRALKGLGNWFFDRVLDWVRGRTPPSEEVEGSMQHGGPIGATGLYMLHAGEYVVPASIMRAVGAAATDIGEGAVAVDTNPAADAWQALANLIAELWNSTILPTFQAFTEAWNALALAFAATYDSIIKPTWDALLLMFVTGWETVIRPTWDTIREATNLLGQNVIDTFNFTGLTVTLTVNSLTQNIRDRWNWMIAELRALNELMLGNFRATWDAMNAAGHHGATTTGNTITETLRQVGDDVTEIVRGYAKSLRDALNPILEGIGETDKQIRLPFRRGGRVPGIGDRDTVPAMLTPGEWVLTKQQASAIGYDTLSNLRHYQAGGLVEAERVARSMLGKPYIWGGAGFGGADCSGLWSMIYAAALGLPIKRYFTTHSFYGGLPPQIARGPGAIQMGVNPSHMAGDIQGRAYEARGRAIPILGPGAASAAHAASFGGNVFHVVGFEGGAMGILEPISLPEIPSGLDKHGPWYGGTAKEYTGWVRKLASDWVQEATYLVHTVGGGDSGFSEPIGGNVAQWIAQAMRITGVNPAIWASPLARQVQSESGGNPRAINLWDSNARRGTPSMGLMQTIQSTFNAHSLPGMKDIWNPVHNLVAAIRYIMGAYGATPDGIGRWPVGRGYDNGGWLEPGRTIAINRTGRPEPILTAEQWDKIERIAERGAGPALEIKEANFYQETDVEMLMRKTAWAVSTEKI